MKLDLHSLIVFYHVANEGSITAAANRLFLTQPTVTYHIRSLERNVGVKLLDIKRQKIALTRAGNGLFRYAAEIYKQMSGAEKYLENIRETSLRVGFSTTFSACAARAASVFEKRYPGVKLAISGASSYELTEKVRNSELDLAIVVSMDYGDDKLRNEPLSARQKLLLVASASSPITRRPNIDFSHLCGTPLVVGPETSASRRIMLTNLRIGGCAMPAPIIVEVNSAEWGITLVENGRGVGLYHEDSVREAIREGRLKELPLSPSIMVGMDAVVRADAPEHPMAEKFISLVKELIETESTAGAADPVTV